MYNYTKYSWPEKFGWIFHVVDREKLISENMEDVPHITKEMFPIIMTMMLMEHFISKFMGKGGIKFSDGIASFANAFLLEWMTIIAGGAELYGYVWLYKYRFFDLDFRNPYTFWMAAIAADFSHYVIHRASHEISILWAVHQVHHSAEEHNLTTATRQPALNRIYRFGLFHAYALLGVPLPTMYLATQINLLAQFWTHTRVIGKLGPLEWILVTPSHHRVHHGMNKWCLDKNYGGVLIIWDKLFGTFQAERDNDDIVYGLVSQPQTLNPIKIQTGYPIEIIKRSLSMDNWRDSLKALFYGPGWIPGSPRLGDLSTMPDPPTSRKKFAPKLSISIKTYIAVHFVIGLIFSHNLGFNYDSYGRTTVLVFSLFGLFTFYTIGAMFDKDDISGILEFARCVGTVALMVDGRLIPGGITGFPLADTFLIIVFSLSALFWSYRYLNNSKIKEE